MHVIRNSSIICPKFIYTSGLVLSWNQEPEIDYKLFSLGSGILKLLINELWHMCLIFNFPYAKVINMHESPCHQSTGRPPITPILNPQQDSVYNVTY